MPSSVMTISVVTRRHGSKGYNNERHLSCLDQSVPSREERAQVGREIIEPRREKSKELGRWS
jgi:hypothetical protein